MAVNPLKKVPALVVDGHPLVESLAIIEYLDEAYPEVNPLLPKDLTKRAQARAIALHVPCALYNTPSQFRSPLEFSPYRIFVS